MSYTIAQALLIRMIRFQFIAMSMNKTQKWWSVAAEAVGEQEAETMQFLATVREKCTRKIWFPVFENIKLNS